MDITRDDPTFRPVTIRIETQDELDQFLAVISAVANNQINHLPQVSKAAKTLYSQLSTLEE